MTRARTQAPDGEDFEADQVAWLKARVRAEIFAQIAEVHIIYFRHIEKQARRKITTLEKDGANGTSIQELKDRYSAAVEVWSACNPDASLEIDIRKLNESLHRLERDLKTPDHSEKLMGMPTKRTQARRLAIKVMADNGLRVIKDRYKIKFGRKGNKRFDAFLDKNILGNGPLYNFLFEGKNKPPADLVQFKTIRATSRRAIQKIVNADIHYQKFQSLLSNLNSNSSQP